MGRPTGSRNRDYAQTRYALACAVGQHLLRPGGEPATFTDLAAAAGVSPTTLKHYFADRDGVFDAVMEVALTDSSRYLDDAAAPGGRTPEESLGGLVAGTVEAWRRFGLGRLFACSLAWGLEHQRRGPAFLEGVLEPFLQAAERLLAAHVERGELAPVDVRATALGLLAPVVLALLHQDSLGGHTTRRLDVEQFARQHLETVLHGIGPSVEGRVTPPQGGRGAGRDSG